VSAPTAGPRAHLFRQIRAALASFDEHTDAGRHDLAAMDALDVANLAAALALETEKVCRFYEELRGVNAGKDATP
jgi:hypothetical protein